MRGMLATSENYKGKWGLSEVQELSEWYYLGM